MLAPEMLVPVGIFALLESGCTEVWRQGDCLWGIEPSDSEQQKEAFLRMHADARRYAYRGTAGDRNVHLMSGRVVMTITLEYGPYFTFIIRNQAGSTRSGATRHRFSRSRGHLRMGTTQTGDSGSDLGCVRIS